MIIMIVKDLDEDDVENELNFHLAGYEVIMMFIGLVVWWGVIALVETRFWKQCIAAEKKDRRHTLLLEEDSDVTAEEERVPHLISDLNSVISATTLRKTYSGLCKSSVLAVNKVLYVIYPCRSLSEWDMGNVLHY